MQLFIQALLVITYVAGTFCQKITFDAEWMTVDKYFIDGTIRGNVTECLLQKWQHIIYIQVKRINDSKFFLMCVLDLSRATCTPDPGDICQCSYNTTTDNVHFVVNGTAGPDLYNATIRAEWQHQNQAKVYSDKNYTVPEPKEQPKPLAGDNITLIVLLSVTIPVVIITVVIGIVWYFKAKLKRSKAVSNNGTDSKAVVDASEQPKPDRHYTEHTKLAYEERRTSPSNVTIGEVKATPNNNMQQHNSYQNDVNNSHIKDNTNDRSASQTVPGEPRRLPPLKATNIHGQLQPTGQPRAPSVETSQSVKHNN